MILAKVISRVVSSSKFPTLPARAMLSVEPLPGFGDPSVPLIALDSVGAGPGDHVLVLQEGTGAREVTLSDPKQPMPAQMAIVGIVDQVDIG
jgi:microcompartment protein CcmK/EutM